MHFDPEAFALNIPPGLVLLNASGGRHVLLQSQGNRRQ
jgi:hypothetical protein